MFHLFVAAVVGAAVGAAFSVGRDVWNGDPIDWRGAGTSAVVGAVGTVVTVATFGAGTGILAAALPTTARLTTMQTVGSAAGMGYIAGDVGDRGGRITDNLLHERPLLEGATSPVSLGGALGAVTGGLGARFAPVFFAPWAVTNTTLTNAVLPKPSTSQPAQPTKLASSPRTYGAADTNGKPFALLPGGKKLPPDDYSGGYHGNDLTPAQVKAAGGLPAKGNDWDLARHAHPLGGIDDSAFRGSTKVPSSPIPDQGAAYWGKYVYEVDGVPTWDVNKALGGRVPRPDGTYGGNVFAETEHAIPARVPLERIKRWGEVVEGQGGRRYVREWVDNPDYKPLVAATAKVENSVPLSAADAKGIIRPSGTLALERSQMPQILPEHYPEYVAYLRSKGVVVESKDVPVGAMRATQSEINAGKVSGIMKAITDGKTSVEKLNSTPILMSGDNFILDGHHRWAAFANIDPNMKVPTLSMPGTNIRDLLEITKGFPKVTYVDINGVAVPPTLVAPATKPSATAGILEAVSR